jgi:hypothetical protein
MKWLISTFDLLLCCNTILAQYFDSTYNNTSFYSELSSHISVLSDSTYLVPSVSTDQSGFHYNWRNIGTNGVGLFIHCLIDTTKYMYPSNSESFFQLSDGNFLQAFVLGRPGLMKFK